MTTPIFEGFSISHAAILNGTTGVEETWGDIYGVREGSLEVSIDSYDNTGDDAVLSSWFWFNYATVTIQGGYLPFSLIANLTGATITSSGANPNDYFTLPLWTETSLNQVTRPMVIRVPSKSSAAATRTLDIVLYKVQFEPLSFTGPTYKDGLVINYSGRALMSSTDEAGGALGTRAIGKLYNKP